MYPENPEEIRIIVGSMNMGYVSREWRSMVEFQILELYLVLAFRVLTLASKVMIA